jgi:nucleoside-diphosphate-sugar epimerase
MSQYATRLGAKNPLQEDLDQVLARTLPFWDEVRGNRLFITGGTGFFGCWLLESFAWACERLHLDTEAVVLTRDPEAFARKAPHLVDQSRIRLLRGDVVNFEFPDGPFSHIVHAATDSNGHDANPLHVFDTINAGTRRTLDFARHCGADKYLLTSSGAVYGRQPPDLTHLTEDFQGAPEAEPRSAYGEGKRVAELLCTIYAAQTGFQTKIARCFAFVGPYLPLQAQFAIGNFIRDALAERPIDVRGDGTAYRSYMYAADLMVWLWTILSRGVNCRPYNVGSEQAMTIAETARVVAGVQDPACEVVIRERANPTKPALRYVPSTERARTELGLTELHDVKDGVARTMAFQRRTGV